MQPAVIPAEVPFGQTEVDLVRRAAHGDVAAFESLVAARAHRIHRIARAILGNEPDASDATQEAFLSAWRELPRLRDAAQFDAWLRRIVVNACRSQLRAKGRVREIPMDITFDQAQGGPLTADQVSDADLLGRASIGCQPTSGRSSRCTTSSTTRSRRSPEPLASPRAPSSGASMRLEPRSSEPSWPKGRPHDDTRNAPSN